MHFLNWTIIMLSAIIGVILNKLKTHNNLPKTGTLPCYCIDTDPSPLVMNKLTSQSPLCNILLGIKSFIYFLKLSDSGLEDQHICLNGRLILHKKIEIKMFNLHNFLSMTMHRRPSCITKNAKWRHLGIIHILILHISSDENLVWGVAVLCALFL